MSTNETDEVEDENHGRQLRQETQAAQRQEGQSDAVLLQQQLQEARREAREFRRQIEELRRRDRIRDEELRRQNEELCRRDRIRDEELRRQIEIRDEELRRQNEELRRQNEISNGTYYATINELWEHAMSQFGLQHFTALRRANTFPLPFPQEAVTERSRLLQLTRNEWWATLDNQENNGQRAALQSNSGSNSTQVAAVVVDVFGNSGGRTVQLAHLIPDSVRFSTLYADFVCCVFGLNPDIVLPLNKLKLIHGTSGLSRRISQSGLKHSLMNKIRLHAQSIHYDQNPSVIIVPILTLEDAKNWTGGEYDAIVMVGGFPPGLDAGSICQQILMTNPGHEVRRGDPRLRTACCLLRQLTLGFTHMVRERALPDFSNLLSDSDWAALQSIYACWRTPGSLEQREQNHLVPVPILSAHLSKPVRLIHFGFGENQHPPPHPMLVGVKAVDVWCRRFYENLRAASGCSDDDDISAELALEQYVDMLKEWQRPQTMEDLARGLHQPNGYFASIKST